MSRARRLGGQRCLPNPAEQPLAHPPLVFCTCTSHAEPRCRRCQVMTRLVVSTRGLGPKARVYACRGPLVCSCMVLAVTISTRQAAVRYAHDKAGCFCLAHDVQRLPCAHVWMAHGMHVFVNPTTACALCVHVYLCVERPCREDCNPCNQARVCKPALVDHTDP